MRRQTIERALAHVFVLGLGLWAGAAQANPSGLGAVNVLAGWDSAYDVCESRSPGLQGYRDILFMLAYGTPVKMGSDDYRRAVQHLAGVRRQPRYEGEYHARRAKVAQGPADRLASLCERMEKGVREVLAQP
jgi:hypothetical protein